MVTADAVLQRARGEIGTSELPIGSNRTPYSEWYGVIGPWCAMFLSWCFYREGLPLPATTHKGFAYCPSGAAWFKQKGRWTSEPEVGHVVFFDFGLGRESHVGLVTSVHTDGTIETCEGNTDSAAGRTGGRVMLHQRRRNILGYGIPPYSENGQSAPTPELLQLGARGAAVARWQRDLNEATGAGLLVDGDFGPLTHEATLAFQRHANLEPDGTVGLQDREQLDNVLVRRRQQPSPPIVAVPAFPGRDLSKGATGPDVLVWTAQMQKRGWRIEVGRRFSSQCERVCRAFQEEKGLAVDGLVGPETWRATWTAPVERPDTTREGETTPRPSVPGHPRQLSQSGVSFIAGFEGFQGELHRDPAGHTTIGYGHLVHRGRVDGSEPEEFRRGISEARALELLRADTAKAARGINDAVVVGLTQAQFDALVSFTFNVGVGAFSGSTLLRLLNAGRYAEVPRELDRWVHAGGRKLGGLVKRRAAEGRLFRDGVG